MHRSLFRKRNSGKGGRCTLLYHGGEPGNEIAERHHRRKLGKKINTAYIYIFQAATGQLLYLHTLNSSNINALNSGTNNTVSFIVPINGSQNCNVYMVANTLLSGSTSTESSFLASIEQDITSYNGKFTRNKGYFITAKVNKLINILSSSPSKVCEIHAFNE